MNKLIPMSSITNSDGLHETQSITLILASIELPFPEAIDSIVSTDLLVNGGFSSGGPLTI